MAQNSDPLPYVQLDRAAKPKIIALATLIGTTTQHAQGSLMDFWEICGDPRDLERIIEAGGDAVVLPAKDITQRFRLASGKEVDPDDLAAMGLLEPKDGEYRVRGMSRFFEPIRRRLAKRNAGKAGGLASVAARKGTQGTAQPCFELGSGSASSGAQALAEAAPKQPRSSAEARTEAAPNTEDRGQRTEDISKEEEGASPSPIERRAGIHHEKPTTPPEAWLAPEFFRWAQHVRQINGYVGEPWPKGHSLRDWFAVVLSTPGVTVARLKQGFYAYGVSDWWKPKNYPFAGFMSQWASFMPQEDNHAGR